MKNLFLSASFLLFFILSTPFLFGRTVEMKMEPEPGSESETEQKSLIFPEPPRETRRAMEDAKKLMEMERFAEAVRKLDQILGAEDDFFYLAEPSEDGKGGVFRNLKQEAEQILETLPPKGLELYEVEFGTTARLLLNDGLEQGKMELVARAANRYFFTRAGSEATFLRGLDLLDRQQPAAARELFLKLRAVPTLGRRFEPVLTLYLASADFASGREEEAVQLLTEAKKTYAVEWNALKIGGKPLSEVVPNGASAPEFAAWLKSQVPVLAQTLPESAARGWSLLLQNQARSTDAGKFSMPILTPCWRVSMIDDPEGTVLLALLTRANAEIPLHSPLVVGNTALMRTVWNLTAIDLQTGKKLWAVPTMDYAAIRERLNRLEPTEKAAVQGLPPEEAAHQLMAGLLKHQVFGEEAYATLASDGTRVFCVEDSIQRFLPTPDSIAAQRRNPRFQPRLRGVNDPSEEQQDAVDLNTIPNRLACYNIQTGKLVWHLGGQSLEQSGTMFLGAPLCVGETLYVLGQRAGTVRLLVLESQTGKLLWSQTLCLAPSEPGPTPISCTPRLTNGTIVCPTPLGALIGVNSVTRALVWGNVCGESLSMDDRQMYDTRAASMITSEIPDARPREIVTFEGKILYLAAGKTFARLVCVDSVTGQTLWTAKGRQDCEAILAVNAEEVTLKTHEKVLKLNLADGSEIKEFPLPPVSGLGFRTGNSLVFPFGDALVQYSIETLKEEARATRPEPGRLGNLIPAGEFLLSQNGEALEAFIQGDAADDWLKRTREADSTSPEAIQVEAVRLWNAGKLPEAIALLKTGGEYTRDLMKRAILAFAESATSSPDSTSAPDSVSTPDEYYAELETTEEKLRFSTRIVGSFLAVKRWPDALAWTRRTVDLLKASDAAEVLIPVPETTEKPRDLKQSPDAWLAATLDRFARELPADSPLRTELETWAEAEYAPLHKEFEALAAESSSAETPSAETRQKAEALVRSLSRFRLRFRFWAGLKGTEDEFYRLLKLSRNFLLLESYIIQKAPSDAAAGAELVRVYRELGDDSRAALALRWLERKFPNEAVLDGKTARAWWLSLPETDPARLILDPEFTPFPEGKIVVRRADEPGNGIPREEADSPWGDAPFGVCLMAGLMIQERPLFDGTGDSFLFCEDSLGRVLFNVHSRPGASGLGPREQKINGRSFFSVNESRQTGFYLGSSFAQSGWYKAVTDLYAPPFRSAVELTREPVPANLREMNSDSFPKLNPAVSFQAKPEPLELGLEPYLKPIQKQLQEEGFSVRRNPFTAFKHSSDSLGETLFCNDATLRRFGFLEGEFLWQSGKIVPEIEKVKPVRNLDWMEVPNPFVCYGELFEDEQSVQAEPENQESSESEPTAEAEKKPEIDLASFVPFRVLRDVTLDELQKEVASEEDRDELKPENFFKEVETVDPWTGLSGGKTRFPAWQETRSNELIWGSFGESRNPFLWNQKTRKFVWVVLMNPRLQEEEVPYFLDSGNLENGPLAYVLNWKHQMEVFNLLTGTHAVLDFPPAANLPKGRDGKTLTWDPKKVVCSYVLPDENGCFTAVLSYEEDYEEPLEENLEENEGDATGETPDAEAENAESETDAESEETTDFSGEGFPLNHALVCRFDADGKPLWEKSYFVRRSWLVEDLPTHIPVLCLARQESSYVESASRDSTDARVIEFLDRRNGRLVYSGKFPVDQRLSTVGDPLKGTARMGFQKFCLDFHFTSEPYAANETVSVDESAFLSDLLRMKEKELNELKTRLEGYKKEIEQEKQEFGKLKDPPLERKEMFQTRMKAHEMNIADFEREIEKLEKEIEDLKKKMR